MSADNKVVWSEGMFLRTQHFQQFDRYVEKLVRGGTAGLRPYGWGVAELQINRELLKTGKFAISTCRGILEDGTPFSIPDDADHPPPLELADSVRNAIVYLVLPVRQPGGIEFDAAGQEETVARYSTHDYNARDAIAGAEGLAQVQVGRLRLRLALETEELAGYVKVGLARVVEVRADRNIVLDDAYIPPTLDCAAAPVLAGYIAELQGLIHTRGEALGARVAESGTKGVAEIYDFLLLQMVNRYEPLFNHLLRAAHVHPETLYTTAVALAGEFCTFTTPSRRPPAFPTYRHEDLQHTFRPVIASLRESFRIAIEPTAIPIPLQQRPYNVSVAAVPDRDLLTQAGFVLVVRAEMPAELLRRHFPPQVTIGPVEKIREMVNSRLRGIRVRPLQVAPRQMPYNPGATYFELERNSPFWRELKQSGGMAIHISGDFPKIEMELWAIRGYQG